MSSSRLVADLDYAVHSRIGRGTFSEIYSARALSGSSSPVAVKIDTKKGAALEWESNVLVDMQSESVVPRHYKYEAHDEETDEYASSYEHGYSILIMELLGPSISQLRHRQTSSKIPLNVAKHFGIEIINCLEKFHKKGYVHRDIKPSNFVCGRSSKGESKKLFIIDFGLVKQFRDKEGEIVPERDRADFRGTSMYASINAHKERDLSPRDDMWSAFYVIVDLLRGELPWKEHAEGENKSREKAAEMKEKYHQDIDALLEGIPIAPALKIFAEHLKSLKYQDFPDYKTLRECLKQLPETKSDEADDKFVWDVPELRERQNVPAINDFAHLNDLSEEDCARKWQDKALELLSVDNQAMIDPAIYSTLLEVAQRHDTFFCTELKDGWTGLQYTVHQVEQAVQKEKNKSKKRALPKITGFQSERPKATKHLRKTLSMALGVR